MGAGPAGEAYLAFLTWVRRQRVQTSCFVATPFVTTRSGWRLG
jgi:hypothetical protein